MRTTGIIRRIDDLGRIAIPKEIRKNLKIREGEPLEIFIDSESGAVCFKPYERQVSRILERTLDTIGNIEGVDYADGIRELLIEFGYIEWTNVHSIFLRSNTLLY